MKTLNPVFLQIAHVGPYTCRSCRSALQSPIYSHSSRLYSSRGLIYPPTSGFTRLQSRRLISLSGPDAARFLQGVITSSIDPTVPRMTGFYSALLNPTGRVLYDVFIYPDFTQKGDEKGLKESWLIEVDGNEAERLFKHIKRYKLRAKFDLRLEEVERRGIWSLWRDESEEGWKSHSIGESTSMEAEIEGRVGCVDSRAPGMGMRLVLNNGKKPMVEGLVEVTEEVYHLRRYMRGVAEGQREILQEVALPQESNIDLMGGLDYRKGCYVGQELTIRTHHTGVVRKRILPVVLYGETEEEPKTLSYKSDSVVEMPPSGTSIARVEKRGRSAGKFLAGLGNIGLSLCRLEIMTDTGVQGEMGSYKADDELKLRWEDENGNAKSVKVKAFIPPWHLKN